MIVEQNASGAQAMSDAEAVTALRCSPLFAETTDAEVTALAASCRIQSAPAGTIILKEGDETDDVYLLLGGELLVYTHDDTGRQLALARLSEVNAYVGEQGFLSAHRARRSAGSVRYPGIKIHDMRVIRLFEVLLHGGPHVGGWTAKQIHRAVLTTFHLSERAYGLNQLRYDLRNQEELN